MDVLTRDKIVNTFEPSGCGCYHPDNQRLDFHKLSQLSALTQQFPTGSCRECHDNEHKRFLNGHHINYYKKRNIRIHLNYIQDWNGITGGGVCHQEQYLSDPKEKERFRRSKGIHQSRGDRMFVSSWVDHFISTDRSISL